MKRSGSGKPASVAKPSPPPDAAWFHKLGQPSPYSLEQLVLIGKVGKGHGVQGAFQCVPITDYPERFESTEFVHVHNGKPPVRRLKVESVLLRSNRIVLKLEGVDTPDMSELLKHYLLAAGEDELVDLEEGEYYHFQLEGLNVIDENGQALGKMKEVLATPAHEIYVVQGKSGEILVPAVPEYILDVDIQAGFVRLRLPVEAEDSDFA